jgi:hypothetical protein
MSVKKGLREVLLEAHHAGISDACTQPVRLPCHHRRVLPPLLLLLPCAVLST